MCRSCAGLDWKVLSFCKYMEDLAMRGGVSSSNSSNSTVSQSAISFSSLNSPQHHITSMESMHHCKTCIVITILSCPYNNTSINRPTEKISSWKCLRVCKQNHLKTQSASLFSGFSTSFLASHVERIIA